MAFKETLTALMKKESKDHVEVAEMMGVDKSQVYRYLQGKIEPKWANVLLLLEGLGYELKITKK